MGATSEQARIVGLLEATTLFAGLPGEEIERAATSARLRTYPRSHLVYAAGEVSETLAIVAHGRVKVAARSADGGELTLAVLQPGGVFGELGVIDGGPRSADAEMLDSGEVVLIPRVVVSGMLERLPALSLRMLMLVSASLRRLNELTADLVFLDLPRRLAKLLLEQPRSPQGVVELGLSQEQIAHLVGGSRQSVNSALSGFSRRGWIVQEGSAFTILGGDALAQFAGAPAAVAQ